ncbi:hypothetical protein [Sphingomonas sanguinis]|nr:hypothetical protein [Sphingomonas sanguinis]
MIRRSGAAASTLPFGTIAAMRRRFRSWSSLEAWSEAYIHFVSELLE